MFGTVHSTYIFSDDCAIHAAESHAATPVGLVIVVPATEAVPATDQLKKKGNTN